MAHSLVAFITFLAAVFTVSEHTFRSTKSSSTSDLHYYTCTFYTMQVAAAANCYDYTTYSSCTGKPCGTNGKCYWKIYIGKRAADVENEDVPQIANENEDKDREKR